jgi:hypothetical protein
MISPLALSAPVNLCYLQENREFRRQEGHQLLRVVRRREEFRLHRAALPLIDEQRCTSPTSSAQVSAVIGPIAGMLISRSTRCRNNGSHVRVNLA